MSKINKRVKQPLLNQPIKSAQITDSYTYNQGAGFTRDPLSELFLLAVSNFAGEDTFYEKAAVRDQRFTDLITQAVKTDLDWVKRFLPWLRNTANMRTVSVMGAVDAAMAMRNLKIPGGRQLIASVLSRPDEPGEAVAYARTAWGRHLPNPVRRGIADAAVKLYNEKSLLKYDTESAGYRFGDVIELCHPRPSDYRQSALFRYAISRGKGRTPLEVPTVLKTLQAATTARKQAASGILLDSETLKDAGMTWQAALSATGGKVSKKQQWEQTIPTMGYMALLRNLRNFDEAGIDRASVELVQQRLADPGEVARSRQFPIRFYSAFRELSSLHWGDALQRALDLSVASIPVLPGRTLVLVDSSGSMSSAWSANSQVRWYEVAALFGLAVAQRCETVDVVSFSGSTRVFPVKSGEALLLGMRRWQQGGFNMGGGTATELAVRSHFRNHDRVVILTDEQADAHGRANVFAVVPESTPVITFNLAGYKSGHAPTGTRTRVTVGGLSDSAFQLLPMLEAHGRGQWPF